MFSARLDTVAPAMGLAGRSSTASGTETSAGVKTSGISMRCHRWLQAMSITDGTTFVQS